jgi:transcriptional regulator with XRE-family HTH domain
MANLTKRERFGREFGALLKAARTEKKLTLEELGELCEIDMGNLSKIERGMNVPRVDTAFKVASALGVTLDKLRPT